MNLHCGVDARGDPYDVTGAISQLTATVICVQEDWVRGSASEPTGPDRIARAADTLGVNLYRAPIWPGVARPVLGIGSDGGLGDLCISVLTALPVTGYEVVPLGHGPRDSVPRYAQVLRLGAPGGGTLRLVNTHLSASVASPLQLGRLWRQLRADPVPTLIAGDLNMPALVARRYPGLTGLVRGRTFPADRPLVQLDHVLVSRGIEAGSGSVLPHAGSDHRPVMARFRPHGSG
jgi:endonuclease/exonuclease/phosphatase family metal-dependent hydrolase